MTIDELWAFITAPGTTFVVGGVAGFLANRITMTASERSAHRQRLYENGNSHKREKEKRYLEYVSALGTYCAKIDPATLSDFQIVSTAGELYFNELKIIASAILDGRIDAASARDTFVPNILEALDKNIPQHYDTLHKMAARIGVAYDGQFKRSNYEPLFKVVEKYASNDLLPSLLAPPRNG
ncbi:hypothetical protein ACVWWG_009401 [Bradyrhizobium sp. LB7.2]